mgnify:CR=1 FL=1
MQQLTFISVFITVMGGMNLYTYRRFFRKLPTKFHLFGAVVTITLMLAELLFVADRLTGLLPDSVLLSRLSTTAVGISFMLFVVTLIYDLMITTSRQLPFDHQRREAIKWAFDVTMLTAAAAYLLRGFVEGAKPPVLNEVSVTIPGFPEDGFTIIQLSDVHVGHTIRRSFMQSIVARVNALQPGLVVITGDLFDRTAARIAEDLEPLRGIIAPTYFVTGNHEYFRGVTPALEMLRSLGVIPLTNQHRQIVLTQGRFNLLGVNDLVGAGFGVEPFDIDAAYEGLDASLPTVVLSHQPKSIHYFEEQRCDLMLSGHTHGGQIFPFGLLVKLDQPYVAGLYQHNVAQQIFVSRGTGYWGPPIRVLAPSEISKITIRNR